MSPERMGGEGAVLDIEMARAKRAGTSAQSVILVEGTSDRRAIVTLARRKGRDLEAEGVAVIATTGATNFPRFVDVLGPAGHDVTLVGLCDRGEEVGVRRSLQQAGIASTTDRLEDLGFFVCVRDLEDELLRSLGADVMVRLIEGQGHLRRFTSFQNQPAQRHKTIEQQIWRWLGNHKIRYAPLMVDALDESRVPDPLEGVLAAL